MSQVLELVADTDLDAVFVVAGRSVARVEVEALLAVIRVAVFEASRDVVGQHRFGTCTDGPADGSLGVGRGSIRFLGLGSSNTGRTVEHERVEVVAEAAANRAVYTVLAGDAVTAGVGAGVAQVAFDTVYDLTILPIITGVNLTAESVGVLVMAEVAHIVGAGCAEVEATPVIDGSRCILSNGRLRNLFDSVGSHGCRET